MPLIDDDLPRKSPFSHEIGQKLDLLSVDELRERVAMLKDEVARLEAEIAAKTASKSAADLFFKR